MASVNAEHRSLGRGVGKTKSIKPWYGLGGEGNAFLFLRARSQPSVTFKVKCISESTFSLLFSMFPYKIYLPPSTFFLVAVLWLLHCQCDTRRKEKSGQIPSNSQIVFVKAGERVCVEASERKVTTTLPMDPQI